MRVALAAALAGALLLPGAAAAGAVQDASRYLEGRAQADGGFAEPGGRATPGLTAWAVLGLRAAGVPAARLSEARRYLEQSAAGLESLTDAELVLAALGSLGAPSPSLVARVRGAGRADGRIGPAVNSTIWGILALRAAGEPAPPGAARFLLRRQHSSGGWSWTLRGAPDSNDTAAAIMALRATGVGVRNPAVLRGLRFLRRHQNPDGGFELVAGRGSDAQSTAWAIQAFLAAKARPGAPARRYLLRLGRPDGSFRYSARYAVTPVWVTAQVVPALAGKPLPLRRR